MDKQKTWIELMTMPAEVIIWRHGQKIIRNFDELCEAIQYNQNTLKNDSGWVESITAADGSVWSFE